MIASNGLEIYEVIFYDEDRATVLKDLTTLNYGEPIIPPQSPVKQNTENWEYAFEGWLDQNGNWLKPNSTISENLIYIAQYKEVKHNYSLMSMVEPKCIDDGVKHYICLNCSQKKDVVVPALGHLCKATNVARNKNAMRRGAAMVCTRKGCDYWYSFQFQNKPSEEDIWEVPPQSGVKDRDSFINGVFHFGADETESKPTMTIKEDKRTLILRLTEEMIENG